MMMANAGLLERTHDISEAASARLVHLLLDGFRAAAASDGPPAPSAREAARAKRRNGQRRLGSTRRGTKSGTSKNLTMPLPPLAFSVAVLVLQLITV
ncbi:MAG TPA: hypothetical protein VGR06_29890 [Actinophytocola sp.]|jgi:hypothetical protein|nr:hypothetical protein [Actinophytocola sp.]